MLKVIKYIILFLTACFFEACSTTGTVTTNITYNNLITGGVTNASCSNPCSGTITQSMIATIPDVQVTHTWSNNATTQSLTGLCPNYPNNYQDKILFTWLDNVLPPAQITKSYEVLYNVDWPTLNSISYDAVNNKLSASSSVWGEASSANLLPQNALGYFDFVLDGIADGTGTIGFNNYSAYTSGQMVGFCGFLFFMDANHHLCYEVCNNNNLLHPTIHPCFIGDKFEVAVGYNGMYYLRNNTIVSGPSLNANWNFAHPDFYIQANLMYTSMKYKAVAATFNCEGTANYYATLSKDLDATYYIMTNDIRVKYKEKYNDNVFHYNVYDWMRNCVVSSSTTCSVQVIPTTTNTNGMNFHIIPVGTNIPSGSDIYTLETTNDKGETYKMKFKYNAFNYTYPNGTLPVINFQPNLFPGIIAPGRNFRGTTDYSW